MRIGLRPDSPSGSPEGMAPASSGPRQVAPGRLASQALDVRHGGLAPAWEADYDGVDNKRLPRPPESLALAGDRVSDGGAGRASNEGSGGAEGALRQAPGPQDPVVGGHRSPKLEMRSTEDMPPVSEGSKEPRALDGEVELRLTARAHDSRGGGFSEPSPPIEAHAGAQGGAARGAGGETPDHASLHLAGPSVSDTVQVRSASAGPDRDLRRLDPRLRAAVTRVLDRLEAEHGIEGEVVEGFRSASRQRALYAQGRSGPGKVVTWTLDSAHMRGRAVDLVLDQQWSDLTPYRVLQEVAAEEGLKTLGMQDPGHLELEASRGDLKTQGTEAAERRSSERRRSSLARAASVAGVAGRASVARAANPAVPGVSIPLSPAPTQAPSRLAERASDSTPIPDIPDPVPSPVLEEPAREVVAAESRAAAPASRPEPRADFESGSPGGASGGVESGPRGADGLVRAGGSTGAATADRVEQVRQVQDAAEGRRAGATVDLGDVDGRGTRVRLNLRGGKIGARIDTPDPALRAVLEDKSPVLKSALEARGLESDGIQIRTLLEEAAAVRTNQRGQEVAAGLEGQGARESRDRGREGFAEPRSSRQEPKPDDFRQRRQREEGRDDR